MSENDFLTVVAVCLTAIAVLVIALRYRSRQRAADRAAAKNRSTP